MFSISALILSRASWSVIDAVGDRLGSGYKILGCLDVEEKEMGRKVLNGVKIVGTVSQLKDFLVNEVVDELIFAIPLSLIDNSERQIALAEELGVAVRIVPDWQIHRLFYRPGVAKIGFEDFLGIPTMALTTTPPQKAELLLKNAFDYIFGALLLVLSVPLLIVAACAIKISSKGPVFFKQERCGLNGRKFGVYKLRTMINDAETQLKELSSSNEADGPVFKIKKDPRIIPYLGTFLRKTGLDELPQLINVLKGEMSLIGPRPPLPSEVKIYDIWHRRRLSMKPGITCIWQCTPRRNDVNFEEWMRMDLSYIDNWSLGLDLKILLKTAKVVLTGSGR